MKTGQMELVRGSGNVYRDFGRPNAGLEQARAMIAAKIIATLDERKLSTRDAEQLTGVSHSEFSRIRNAQLRRFTIDRMIAILGKLDEDVEVNVTFTPRRHGAHATPNGCSTMANSDNSYCAQCKKRGVAQVNGVPLCVDCYYKFEVARTLEFRILAIHANQAAADMDFICGLPNFSPKMQVPDIPKGPPILNHIKIDNSVVGSVNTGTVQSIDVNISYLEQSGNEHVSNELKALTEVIANESSIGERDKNNLLEQVAYLSEQATNAAKDRKPGMIRAALGAVGQTATTVTAIATAWEKAGPLLLRLFGIE